MHETPTLLTEPAGILRIFMTSASRAQSRQQKPFTRLFQRRPLYRDIVHAARAAGFTCSNAPFAHYGFWRSGEIQQTLGEIPNTLLSVYVDILGDHEQLQAFCLSHEALLRDTSLYFKPAESWHFATQSTP
ncbi:hypothetical protein GOB86_15045 [Acetobacter lambici]|uniref:DUF190 domain-containing protein n=2 Tax=Acetobacter TaxID=434 RepID=A0A149VGI7_9PROT|nr:MULTISPECIES: hypothetical protein [Acetobacter]KXV79053.1 hypothetical protein AD953_03685 [Acetobacter malorum]NHO58320.1 hypothetical protein [Acetobacter lambici]